MNRNPHLWRIHYPIHWMGLLSLCYLIRNPAWSGLVAFLIANLFISGVGMSVGFHRYFCHKAFTARPWAQWLMLICGSLACQGSVVFWVALHRHHHVYSDTPKDIHSPIHGFWSSYMGWILKLGPRDVMLLRANNLLRMPGVVAWHRNYVTRMTLFWTAILCGLALWPAARPVLCGVLLAQMWAIHQEAIINSACHTFGYRNYNVRDTSTNMWFTSLLTWGQALHNNHHGKPGASFRAKWYEIDLGLLLIYLLRL